ncbi:hypothetical protein [Streptomyces sp. WAC01526]|uniref:hypothetical protein n=1 Tax=Streptomyces sp. WAC01526 TaxID=2588709 RepID=UPI0011E02597|nr:hypothetical protein [Streptomyces sp. WAC01526]
MNVPESSSCEGNREIGRTPINDLLRASLCQIEEFSEKATENPIPSESWESIRSLCTSRMQDRQLDPHTRIRWARIAVTASDRKVVEGTSGLLKFTAEQARIKVYAIREFGVDYHDTVRDPNSLCRQIIASISYRRDEIERDATRWRDLPTPEILTLRLIKNVLTPLRDIETSLPDSPDGQHLRSLLPLIELLP